MRFCRLFYKNVQTKVELRKDLHLTTKKRNTFLKSLDHWYFETLGLTWATWSFYCFYETVNRIKNSYYLKMAAVKIYVRLGLWVIAFFTQKDFLVWVIGSSFLIFLVFHQDKFKLC